MRARRPAALGALLSSIILASAAPAAAAEYGAFEGGGIDQVGVGGGFVFFLFVLWAVIPLVLAVVLARAQNESVGMAVLLTLILGWIGLAIVWYGQRRTVASAVRTVDTATADARRVPRPHTPSQPIPDAPMTRLEAAAAAETAPAFSPTTRVAERSAASEAVAERLRTVDELRDSGLLTEAEHGERRAAILAEL
jgi:hypothetical protein